MIFGEPGWTARLDGDGEEPLERGFGKGGKRPEPHTLRRVAKRLVGHLVHHHELAVIQQRAEVVQPGSVPQGLRKPPPPAQAMIATAATLTHDHTSDKTSWSPAIMP